MARTPMSWFKRASQTLLVLVLTLTLGYLAGVGFRTLQGQHDQLGADVVSNAGTPTPSSPSEEDAQGLFTQEASYTAWDADESPNYYRIMGSAQLETEPEAGEVLYGALDSLGRATGASSLVTYDSMMAGRQRSRDDLSELSPSGWGHNAEVDIAMPNGTLYHGQLYNRSHLVAKSLGGDDELHNLVTATRTQNVGSNIDGHEGGMAYAEGLARTWLEEHPDGTVYYAARPVYEGSELMARSVIVDVRTSDGSIDQRIEVYNATLGFALDYATGGFQVTNDANTLVGEIREVLEGTYDDVTSSDASAGEQVAAVGDPVPVDGERKVIVTGSGSAYHHDESCSGLENARSMKWVTVSEAERMGRHPCGICGG